MGEEKRAGKRHDVPHRAEEMIFLCFCVEGSEDIMLTIRDAGFRQQLAGSRCVITASAPNAYHVLTRSLQCNSRPETALSLYKRKGRLKAAPNAFTTE